MKTVISGALKVVGIGLLAAAACTPLKNDDQDQVVVQSRAVLQLQHGQAMRSRNQLNAAAAPAGAHLVYFGGRVVSNVQVVQVIWGTGSYIPEVLSTASPSMATFYQGVLNSPYVDWLTEYNTNTQTGQRTDQIIGRGTFSTQVTITPSAANNGSTITDTQIQAELSAQIAAGTLPAPTHDAAGNNNTYYAIFFPHGKFITLQGSGSCSAFCAYHGTIANAGGAGEIYYGVHPDFQAGSGCEFGCGSAPTVFGNYTHVASHELIETVTDAEVGLATTFAPPLAWYDQANGEIGDICVGQNGTVVGSDGVTYNVQKEFSNSASDCVVSLGPPAVAAVAVSPALFEGGTPATGTVTLTRAAPAGDATVTLASAAPSLVTVPASVVIPAGASSATFPVTSTPTASQTTVAITATYPTGTTATGNVTVLVGPTPASLMLAPTTVSGGVSSAATVMLSGPAPTGGAVVTLASSNAGVATVPATLTIAEGATTGTFTVTTFTQNVTTTATISASFHGLTRTALITVTLTPSLSSMSVSPSVLEGGGAATGAVFLNTAAPSGGVVVALSSNNGAVTVPASVSVPAGLSSASFAIATTSVSTQTSVTISGTFPSDVTRTASMTILASPTPASVTLAPNPVTGGQTSVGTVTLSGPAPAGGSVVALASSATGVATVPATLTVPAGATSGTFNVATVAQGATLSSTISASLNGLTKSAVLSVTRVLPAGNAVFDPALKAPRCMTADSFCDTGGLIDGRAALGPETNTPNTLAGACVDGVSGTYHLDESLDRLKVSTLDGTPLAAGKTVRIDATVWVWGSTSDFLDLYFAPDANNPVWTPISTGLVGTISQTLQTLSATFVLPSATLPVIRGNWRFSGAVGTCTTGSFDDRDDLVFALATGGPPVNQAPVVNAGADQTVNLPATASLAGTVTDDGLPNPPAAFTVAWSLVSGPGTVTFGSPTAVATSATFSTAGTYSLRLTASDSALSASDDVVVTVGAANQPPVVNAGVDQTVTFPAAANLAGAVTDDGLPNPPAAFTVAWTVVSGPGTVTFGSPNTLTTTATFSAAGGYVLRLTANDSALSASDDVAIMVIPPNQPPVVNAGTDQTITLPAPASLSGTASDDGLPNPPGAVTTAWSKVSGPGTVTFGNASLRATTATFSAAGGYVLRLTASDGALTASDDIAITVNAPANLAPTVNAGPDQTVTLPAAASLSGTASDDGLPNPPATLTTTWSKVSGPGTVTFANPSARATTATFSAAGSYVLRLTASDSALTAADDIAVTVNAAVNRAPTVNAGPDQTITLPATASLSGTASDDGLPNPPATVTTTWSKVSGPGTVTFANPSARATTATFSTAGSYVLRLTASDSALSATDDIAVTVNAAGGTGPCAGLCTNPTNFTISGSFQSGSIGTGAICYQTTSPVHGGNCGNFVSPRTLTVNGTTESCTAGNWASVPAARNGGYCVQTTTGNQPWAFFTAW